MSSISSVPSNLGTMSSAAQSAIAATSAAVATRDSDVSDARPITFSSYPHKFTPAQLAEDAEMMARDFTLPDVIQAQQPEPDLDALYGTDAS